MVLWILISLTEDYITICCVFFRFYIHSRSNSSSPPEVNGKLSGWSFFLHNDSTMAGNTSLWLTTTSLLCHTTSKKEAAFEHRETLAFQAVGVLNYYCPPRHWQEGEVRSVRTEVASVGDSPSSKLKSWLLFRSRLSKQTLPLYTQSWSLPSPPLLHWRRALAVDLWTRKSHGGHSWTLKKTRIVSVTLCF